ncbi:hypothetical protein [Pseudomonas sp. SCB32]|uniref:hypothetical protein n=1 Tax=Pseudomonas sp. SCB32 TaxID=2653853 RepID=UPI00126558AB|nr:hypothetical protein [Pseudomonas sp. SCB32]
MSRFSSLGVAPSETRKILRDRFLSKLPVMRQQPHRADSTVVRDELALRFLAGLTVISQSDWSTAASTYSQAVTDTTPLKDLPAVIEAGWLRYIWGRVGAERALRSAIRQTHPGEIDALQTLLSDLHGQRYEIDVTVREDVELAELVKSFESPDGRASRIVARTPEWVAARLWEILLQKEATPADALRRWVDLWKILGYPSLTPKAVWSEADAKPFRQEVLLVLSEEPALLSWSETRDRYLKQAELAPGHARIFGAADLPLVPRSPIARALWIRSVTVEGFAFESHELFEDLVRLMRVVLSEAGDADLSPAPHPVAAQIFALAADRATLFNSLLFDVQSDPRLLADMVLDPHGSGLACLLIAQWTAPPGGWERDLLSRAFLLDQADAFDDAVSILGEHLRAQKADVASVAALLQWFHSRAARGFVDDVAPADAPYVSLKRELAKCTGETLMAIAGSLDREAIQRGPGEPAFAAVLELCDLGGIEEQIDAEAIIGAYADAIAAGEYSLSAHRIGSSTASALARISQRSESLRRQFLFPMDVKERLATKTEEVANEHVAAYTVIRSVRAHIRILCRAVIGGTTDVPEDLFQALVAMVKTGALEHKEKGRVAAFAPRQESTVGVTPNDRPLAFDLAAALGKIDHPHQERLLAAILETDEPLILAQLLLKCPSHLRQQVDQRIAAIAPTDAGTIHSLSEMQERIRQLIAAGAADAAELYMGAEERLVTMGQVPGRELERFQNQLQIYLLRENWAAISCAQVPTHFSQMDRQYAQESLQFSQALAALHGHNGNAQTAMATFSQLFARRPSWALAANWLIAALRGVLGSDGFAQLQGAQIREGQQLLMQAQSMSSRLRAEPGESSEAFECNRALLLLGLSEPAQALASLTAVTFTRWQDTAAAYRAVAYARMGQKSKATAELDAADYACGKTPVLAAARSHIASGSLYLSVPDVSLHDNLNLPSAIARFLSLDPQRQAQVLKQESNAFELLLIEYVRGASDAVTSLVPMMKDVRIDSCEDDLNALIQRILAARIHFLGWTVEDQSKGGFTGKGNPGERDLLVKWGHTTLAVIEALICENAVTQDSVKANLESHFQKLLGYSTTQIFFHLSYAYLADKQALLQFLETASETACPEGFVYQGRTTIAHVDSRPPGFVASYQGDFGEVKVVFLVLNFGQQRQRSAAKVAAATKVRKAPAKGKGKASLNGVVKPSRAKPPKAAT